MRYTTSLEGISTDMLQGFFDGWRNPPTPAKHLELLQRSYKVVLAIDDASVRVVGFINAVSDGVLSAYIPLLEVLPRYQSQGVGKQLVSRMLKELQDLYMVDLICDESLQNYYEEIGMLKAHGMVVRNFTYQSGK